MASLLAAALPSLQCMSSTRVSSADAFESHGPTVLSSAALGLTSGSGSGASAALAAASASGSGAGSVKLISVVGEAGNLVSQGIACAHGDGRGGKRAKYMEKHQAEKHQAEKHFTEKHHPGGISFQMDSAVAPSAPPTPMASPPDRISAKHATKPAAPGGGSAHVSLDRATAPHASTPGEPAAATLADCHPPYSHIPHCHNQGSGEDQLPPLVSREAVAEASPLGLTLRKTPSLVEFISHRLSQGAGDAGHDGAGDGSDDMDMTEEARTGVPSGGEGGEPAGPAHTMCGGDAQRTSRGMGGGGMNSSSSSSSSEAELGGGGMAQGSSARGKGSRARDEPVRPGSAPAHQQAQEQGRAQSKGIPALVAFGGGATASDGGFASPDGALMAEGALASFSSPFPALPAQPADKLKASNFPATRMTIGTWERRSKYEGDLVAKCYFAKRKLVWEVLEGGLKSKIEVQWGDIAVLRASTAKGQPGVLEIEVSRPPQFFKEMNPQPRRHTLWQSTPDFTAGQANSFRRHVVEFAEGVLNKHLHKLLASDPRLRDLAHGTSAHHTHPGQHGQGGQGSSHMGMHARTHAHAYSRDVLQSAPHKAGVGAMGAMGAMGAGGTMEGVMSYGHGKPTGPHGALPYGSPGAHGSPAAHADPLLPLAHAHGPPHARTHGSVYPRSHSHTHSHAHAGAVGRGSSVGEEGEVAGRGKARQGAAHVAPPYPMLPAGFFPPPPLPQTFFPPPPIMPPFPTHHLPPPPSTLSSPASAAAAAAAAAGSRAAAARAADPRSPLSAPFPPFPYFPSHLYPPPPYLPGGYMSNSYEGELEDEEEEEEEEEEGMEGNEEGERVAVERNEKGEWGKGVRREGDEGEEEEGSGGRCSGGGAAGVGGRGGGEKHGVKGRSSMDLSFPSPAAHYPHLPHPPMWPTHVGLPPAAFWPPFPPPPYPAFPPPAPSATPLPLMHPHAARMHPMHAAPPMHAHAMLTPAMAPHHALLPAALHPAHCHIPTPMGPTHMHTDLHTHAHMRSSSLSSGRVSIRRDLGVQSTSSNSNTALPATSINTSNNTRSNKNNGNSKSNKSKNGSKNVTGSNGFPSSSNCNIPISSTSNSGMGSGGLRESSSPIPSSFLEEVSSMFCDPLPFH